MNQTVSMDKEPVCQCGVCGRKSWSRSDFSNPCACTGQMVWYPAMVLVTFDEREKIKGRVKDDGAERERGIGSWE